MRKQPKTHLILSQNIWNLGFYLETRMNSAVLWIPGMRSRAPGGRHVRRLAGVGISWQKFRGGGRGGPPCSTLRGRPALQINTCQKMVRWVEAINLTGSQKAARLVALSCQVRCTKRTSHVLLGLLLDSSGVCLSVYQICSDFSELLGLLLCVQLSRGKCSIQQWQMFGLTRQCYGER